MQPPVRFFFAFSVAHAGGASQEKKRLHQRFRKAGDGDALTARAEWSFALEGQ
jgi:hypothetical protein